MSRDPGRLGAGPSPPWEPFEEEELLARAASLASCWAELRPKLPADRRWFAGRLDAEAIAALIHVPCDAFRRLSDGTGAVRQTARSLAEGARPGGEAGRSAARVRRIAAGFRAERAGTLVLGANDLEAGPFMLLDGNHRAGAFLLHRASTGRPPAGSLPAVVALSSRPLKPW